MVQTTDSILRKLGHFEHDLCDERSPLLMIVLKTDPSFTPVMSKL